MSDVLVPIDGSDSAWRALDFAVSHLSPTELTVLHVVPPTRRRREPTADGSADDPNGKPQFPRSDALETAVEGELCGKSSSFDAVVTEGRPAHTILEYAAEHDVDQIVVGSRGQTCVKRLLLGSVAETIVRRASVPVTIVR